MEERVTFDMRETRDNAGVRLTLVGELDLATAPKLRERLTQLRDERVAVSLDLSELDFMDSSGLAILIQASRDTPGDLWRFTVLPDLSEQVGHLFDIAGVRAKLLGEHTGHNLTG